MATHKSAIKRHRQSLKRRLRNKSAKSRMKKAEKNLSSILQTKEQDAVKQALPRTIAIISKTATKGVIHKKTAARKISRLTRRSNTVLQTAGS